MPVLSKLTTNEFTVDKCHKFSERVTKIHNANNLFMTFFDVESLFTNVPLYETIDICLNSLFTGLASVILGLAKFFRTLLELSVLNPFFIFNGIFYRQIEGLGMGLPLGPTVAYDKRSYTRWWIRKQKFMIRTFITTNHKTD